MRSGPLGAVEASLHGAEDLLRVVLRVARRGPHTDGAALAAVGRALAHEEGVAAAFAKGPAMRLGELYGFFNIAMGVSDSV